MYNSGPFSQWSFRGGASDFPPSAWDWPHQPQKRPRVFWAEIVTVRGRVEWTLPGGTSHAYINTQAYAFREIFVPWGTQQSPVRSPVPPGDPHFFRFPSLAIHRIHFTVFRARTDGLSGGLNNEAVAVRGRVGGSIRRRFRNIRGGTWLLVDLLQLAFPSAPALLCAPVLPPLLCGARLLLSAAVSVRPAVLSSVPARLVKPQ